MASFDMDSEINFLLLQYANRQHRFTLNDLCAALPLDMLAVRQLALELAREHLLRVGDGANFSCAITPEGRLMFLRMQEHRDQQTQQKAEQRADEAERQRAQAAQADQRSRKQFRHDYAVAAFGSLCGLIFGLLLDFLTCRAGLLEQFLRILDHWIAK